MTKKKRFGISEALTRGLSETINVVENNQGLYRNVVVPLSRIELDPENPRKLAIDLLDVKVGIRPEDPHFQKKQDELERLKELAHTIKTSGIINPIVVYKRGELYRIVAGERRTLASFLAGKQEIEARVFNEKPKAFELKLVQWIENTAREDLSLDERLGNVRDILKEYQAQHDNADITATVLKNITGLSLSQASYYIAALNAPDDLMRHIKDGGIRNLDKAALIAGIESQESRREVIDACLNGSSLKELRALLNKQKHISQPKMTLITENRGRSTSKINMGTTNSAEVIKAIVDSVLKEKRFSHHAAYFSECNWHDLRQTAKAFRRLIELLELEMVR